MKNNLTFSSFCGIRVIVIWDRCVCWACLFFIAKIRQLVHFTLLVALLFLTGTAVAVELPADLEERIKRLEQLNTEFDTYKKSGYQSDKAPEVYVRYAFLDELLRLLDWNVGDKEALYADTVEEQIMFFNQGKKRADYGLLTNDRTQFFVEAKAAKHNVYKKDYVFQNKRYVWSSSTALVGILTNYRQFCVYYSPTKPDYDKPNVGKIENLCFTYKDYPKRFEELYLNFSKPAVVEGAVKRLVLSQKHAKDEKQTMTTDVLDKFNQIRLTLATDLIKNNPSLSEEELNQATHNILNKIFFMRILEDRDIQNTRRLYYAMAEYDHDESLLNEKEKAYWNKKTYQQPASLFEGLQREFAKLDKRLNGVIFAPHFSDKLKVSDDVLRSIINSLYAPVAPYDFANIPVQTLGKIYEQYLGQKVVLVEGRVEITDKPEIKKAGGVFYTPRWVASYIVNETLGKRLKGKTPDEMMAVKTLDLSCGSGAFTAEVVETAFQSALNYFKEHNKPNEAFYIDDAGQMRLSVPFKMKIVQNMVFCTDVDAQAIENTKMWLYVMILEHSGYSVIVDLPELSENIVLGNALIESDFNGSEDAKPYDFNTGKIGDIVKNGGFDVIVGNPPYVRVSQMKKNMPQQHAYIRKKYKTMAKGQADLFSAFFERGLALLNKDGQLGYITSSTYLDGNSGKGLREFIKPYVSRLINFADNQVFKGVSVFTTITFMQKKPTDKLDFVVYKRADDIERVFKMQNANYNMSMEKSDLDDVWRFVYPKDKADLALFDKHTATLKDIADVFRGVESGNNKVFLLELKEKRQDCHLVHSQATKEDYCIEKELLRPLVLGRDLKRYEQPNISIFALYPYHNEKLLSEAELKQYEVAYAYLQEIKPFTNPSKTPYYKWNTAKSFPSEYIVNNFSGQTNFTRVASSVLLSGGLNVGVASKNPTNINLSALTGLLNSNIVRLYLKYNGKLLGSNPRNDVASWEDLPVPAYNENTAPIYQEIGERVERIYYLNSQEPTDLSRFEIKAHEEEIEKLVHKLYSKSVGNLLEIAA